MVLVVVILFIAANAGLLLSLRALAFTGVPVRAAAPEAVEAALDLLALRDGERFVDLGCGGGQVLRAARRRAAVCATGFELNPGAFLAASIRSGPGISVRFGDFRRSSFEGVAAAYAYLMPRAMRELAPVLESRLDPGTRFVSVDFPVPGWRAVEVREVGTLRQPIHLYVIGEHRPEAQRAGGTRASSSPQTA